MIKKKDTKVAKSNNASPLDTHLLEQIVKLMAGNDLNTVDIRDDTDVCIIEAMKVFNNIKAECRGTIVKIMAVSGQTVEFGQTLFLVKP